PRPGTARVRPVADQVNRQLRHQRILRRWPRTDRSGERARLYHAAGRPDLTRLARDDMDNDWTSLHVRDGESLRMAAAAGRDPYACSYPEDGALAAELQPPGPVQAGAVAPVHESESVKLVAPTELDERGFRQPRLEPVVIGTTPRLTSDPHGLP